MREEIREAYFKMVNSMIREMARIKDKTSEEIDPLVDLMEKFAEFSVELLGHKIISEKEHDALEDRILAYRELVYRRMSCEFSEGCETEPRS